MAKRFFTCFIVLISLKGIGQETKSFVVGIAQGKLTSPYYDKSKWGDDFNIDLDYSFTKRGILSGNFNWGKHTYFDPTGSPAVIYGDGTNANQRYYTFSFLYKYAIIAKERFLVSVGTGAGGMVKVTEKFYTETTNPSQLTYPRDFVSYDLVFPVRVDATYKLSSHFHIGVLGGFYVNPDFPILAYHGAIKIGFRLK